MAPIVTEALGVEFSPVSVKRDLGGGNYPDPSPIDCYVGVIDKLADALVAAGWTPVARINAKGTAWYPYGLGCTIPPEAPIVDKPLVTCCCTTGWVSHWAYQIPPGFGAEYPLCLYDAYRTTPSGTGCFVPLVDCPDDGTAMGQRMADYNNACFSNGTKADRFGLSVLYGPLDEEFGAIVVSQAWEGAGLGLGFTFHFEANVPGKIAQACEWAMGMHGGHNVNSGWTGAGIRLRSQAANADVAHAGTAYTIEIWAAGSAADGGGYWSQSRFSVYIKIIPDAGTPKTYILSASRRNWRVIANPYQFAIWAEDGTYDQYTGLFVCAPYIEPAARDTVTYALFAVDAKPFKSFQWGEWGPWVNVNGTIYADDGAHRRLQVPMRIDDAYPLLSVDNEPLPQSAFVMMPAGSDDLKVVGKIWDALAMPITEDIGQSLLYDGRTWTEVSREYSGWGPNTLSSLWLYGV